MKKSVTKDQKGFTIVEVLIVLAIAGLIILIVLLAVPALQRNSRNTQRKNDVSQLSGAISERINNNNGQLDQVVSADGSDPDINQAIRDAVGRMNQLGVMNYAIVGAGQPNDLPADIDPDTVLVRNNMKCNTAYADPGDNTTRVVTLVDAGTDTGNIATFDGATFRSLVAIYPIERSGGLVGQCQDL